MQAPNLFPNIKFILGTKSPRRQFLLKEAGFQFDIRTSDHDEKFPKNLKEEAIPAYLAQAKSKSIHTDEEELLITSDTIVWFKGRVLNKAENEAEARKMLQGLSGNIHWVHTAVCLRQGSRSLVFTESTRVFFKSLSEEEIDCYVNEFKPFDKAGAYGIQEWIGYIGVERIEGCYYNVMGFPISRFITELRQFLGR